MEKILLILQREYWTRVRKKSFLIMSILGPLLIAAIYVVPAWLAVQGSEEKIIQVIDESGLFMGKMEDTGEIKFTYTQEPFSSLQPSLASSNEYDAWLYIPNVNIEAPVGITLYSQKSLSAITQKSIEKAIEREIERIRLKQSGIDEAVLNSIKPDVSIKAILFDQGEEKDSNSLAATVVGWAFGFMIYFFIFLYGAQVMRGVIEEKTNRIVEVMISSVKPFELMMGKVLGLAAVGLTQLLLWIILGYGVVTAATLFFMPDVAKQKSEAMLDQAASSADTDSQAAMQAVMEAASTINFPLIIGCFAFYFVFGYLLYASLFGAIGAAVDSETDTQQFMLPVTVPLILSIVMANAVVADPNGSIAFWMSIIPFTSPIIMMVRVPFIGMSWELLLSMFLLILGFIGSTWVAARIYRVGILMYGKKVTFKELGKWLFYKG